MVWKGSKNVIIEALKKRHGMVTYAAKDLGVHFDTLKRRIDADPSLQELIVSLHSNFDHQLIESAQSVVIRAMSQSEDLGNALRAAFYALNNKGKLRGYNTSGNITSPTQTALEKSFDMVDQMAGLIKENQKLKEKVEAIPEADHLS